MPALLPLLLLLPTVAFASGYISAPKSTVGGNIGVGATTATSVITKPGDHTLYQVITPDKLGDLGLRGLKAGDSVTVTLVDKDIIEVATSTRSVKLKVDPDGGVSVAR